MVHEKSWDKALGLRFSYIFDDAADLAAIRQVWNNVGNSLEHLYLIPSMGLAYLPTFGCFFLMVNVGK